MTMRSTTQGGIVTARRVLGAGPLYKGTSIVDSENHDSAEQRLSLALTEQDRSLVRYEAATGKSDHLVAEAALHAADQEVAAREAWLKWVDDDAYHGLNAGPFEAAAEGSRPRPA
jgi:hypothetical protein